MKKILLAAGLASAFAAFAAAPGAAALKLSLKLCGGAALLLDGAGDLEKFRLGEQALAADWAGDDFRTASFSWKKLGAVPELAGEIIVQVNSRLGIGLGAGFLEGRVKADSATDYDQSWSLAWGDFVETERYTVRRDIRMSAVPITLNLHVQTPLSSRVNVTAYLGAAYYLGRLKHVCDITDSSFYGYTSPDYYDNKAYYDVTSTTTETADGGGFGFQGGAGLEMRLTGGLSLGLEVYGRYAKFSTWSGDSTYGGTSRERFWHEVLGWWYDETTPSADVESGDLYYWEWRSDYYGRDYAALGIREAAPSGGGVKSVRGASLNLNRAGLGLTLRYRFDL